MQKCVGGSWPESQEERELHGGDNVRKITETRVVFHNLTNGFGRRWKKSEMKKSGKRRRAQKGGWALAASQEAWRVG